MGREAGPTLGRATVPTEESMLNLGGHRDLWRLQAGGWMVPV